MKNRFVRKRHLQVLSEHLKTPRPPIQVILGPRQVGKTTAIRNFADQWKGPVFYHTADQVSPPPAAWIQEQWVKARKEIRGKNEGLLIFDEVQKIPRWSEVVKKCYDEDKYQGFPLRVVLLGSSSLLVQRGLTETLAGRFEIIRFPHWSFEECREDFGISLEEYIFYGGYPGALQILQDSAGDEARWRDYVRESLIETVLNRDILLLTPVTKPALFRQVFSLSCLHPSEIFSLNKMLGQLDEAGNASTIASYLKLLDAAMLIRPLEKYSGSRLRQKRSSPKLVVLNNALCNVSQEKKLKEAFEDSARWGRLVENAVGASLIQNNQGRSVEVYYWRERDLEVDFILKKGNSLLALEVKTGREAQNKGLSFFLKMNPKAKGMTTSVGGGDIPVEKLISMSAEELFKSVPD